MKKSINLYSSKQNVEKNIDGIWKSDSYGLDPKVQLNLHRQTSAKNYGTTENLINIMCD